MKTKERILEKGRKMFNSKGIRSISLRNIASVLDISYGNLTYHYASKENLLTWIYIQMMEEHQEITGSFREDEGNYLEKLLQLPEDTYPVYEKYRFLYQDFIEIARLYPSIAEMQTQMNVAGNADLFTVFLSLRDQGLFRKDIDEDAIGYLIELSNYMKSFYFIKSASITTKNGEKKAGKEDYSFFINRILLPYLTPKGMKIYEDYLNR